MNTSTRLIIGAAVILIGAGIIGLGFIEQESDVRYVNDITERPADHVTGSYTLLGMPQPQELPDPQGTRPNPSYSNETTRVIGWVQGGTQYFSTLTLRVAVGETSHWSLENITRIPGQGTVSTTYQNWTIDVPHMVFQIQGFPDENGIQPVVWGVYTGVLTQPMQPKPSQFTGHVASDLFGTPLPDGALVYFVEEYTAGCSSKFLPPDLQEEYKDDPDYA